MNLGNQEAFKALADPSRRAILLHLAERDMTIGEVAENFEMTRAAVKKHLSILEKGNLIHVRANGRERINHLHADALRQVSDWIAHFNIFWDAKLSALETALDNHTDKGKNQ